MYHTGMTWHRFGYWVCMLGTVAAVVVGWWLVGLALLLAGLGAWRAVKLQEVKRLR